MIIFSNAKINIGLNIAEKRNDGFHNIETIFYPINLKDVLEVTENTSKNEFINTGLVVDTQPENNLIIRAYNLLASDFELKPLKIHLHKNIPFGAGLGGGSSNATNMLKLLNNFFELKLNNRQISNYARQIGSDCAFFVENKPVFAYEKGDIFEPINLDLSAYKIILAKPEVFIGTKEAYAGIKPRKPKISLKELINQPIENWKNLIENDFEKSVFAKYTEIKKLKTKFYEMGAIYASMSGSGSSVYGIFAKNSIPEIPENTSSVKWFSV